MGDVRSRLSTSLPPTSSFPHLSQRKEVAEWANGVNWTERASLSSSLWAKLSQPGPHPHLPLIIRSVLIITILDINDDEVYATLSKLRGLISSDDAGGPNLGPFLPF